MVKTLLEVVTEFDPGKDYGFKIRKQYAKCLSILKSGEKINPNEFTQNHLNEFTHGKKSFKTNREAIYHTFWKIGKNRKILSLHYCASSVFMIHSYNQSAIFETVKYLTVKYLNT